MIDFYQYAVRFRVRQDKIQVSFDDLLLVYERWMVERIHSKMIEKIRVRQANFGVKVRAARRAVAFANSTVADHGMYICSLRYHRICNPYARYKNAAALRKRVTVMRDA